MSQPDHNIRPLTNAELDAVLDLVENNGAVVLSNVNAQRQPETLAESVAWATCATSALYLAATINEMRANAKSKQKRKKTGVKK